MWNIDLSANCGWQSGKKAYYDLDVRDQKLFFVIIVKNRNQLREYQSWEDREPWMTFKGHMDGQTGWYAVKPLNKCGDDDDDDDDDNDEDEDDDDAWILLFQSKAITVWAR